MKVETFVCNYLNENCYVVSFDNGEGFIVDCGAIKKVERKAIEGYVKANGITLKACLNTHMHYDHAFGLPFVKKKYGLVPQCSPKEKGNYERKEWWVHMLRTVATLTQGRPLFEFMPDPDYSLTDGTKLMIGGSEIRVIETPGHSIGGLCFYLPKEKVLFTGDTIFYDTIGNTRDKDASMDDMEKSIGKIFKTVPKNVTFYPGHGEGTTLGGFVENYRKRVERANSE